MLAGGADIAVVSKQLGHSSIRVTADMYYHLLEGLAAVADATEGPVRPRATTAAADPAPGAPTWPRQTSAPVPGWGNGGRRCLNQTCTRRDSNP